MRVLITGGTGLLGKSLIETAKKGLEIIATHLGKCTLKDTVCVKYKILDICDTKANAALYKHFRPDVTIHAAGVGSPDYAERHKEEARAINIGGTQNIVGNCGKFRSDLVYISSNGIYDGSAAPYCEDDEARPINYYGQIKLEGENISRKSTVPSSIVRPMLLYGWNHINGRQNIVTYALSRLEKGEEVYVYNDVFANPIFAPACAAAIWKIIKEKRYETFNIAGKETVSIYRLIKYVAETFGFDPNLVIPVQQGFFNELVKRPKDTSFDTAKMCDVLGLNPASVEDGLLLMKKTRKRRL